MIPVISGGAQQARLRLQAEEEEMTRYTPEDVDGDWEFKIVRSASASFRNPETLRRLVVEESAAGWIMLEKFDDSRVRFKRRRVDRMRDTSLASGVDPYRTNWGMGQSGMVIVMIAVMGVFLMMGIMMMFVLSAR